MVTRVGAVAQRRVWRGLGCQAEDPAFLPRVMSPSGLEGRGRLLPWRGGRVGRPGRGGSSGQEGSTARLQGLTGCWGSGHLHRTGHTPSTEEALLSSRARSSPAALSSPVLLATLSPLSSAHPLPPRGLWEVDPVPRFPERETQAPKVGGAPQGPPGSSPLLHRWEAEAEGESQVQGVGPAHAPGAPHVSPGIFKTSRWGISTISPSWEIFAFFISNEHVSNTVSISTQGPVCFDRTARLRKRGPLISLLF